MSSPLRRFSTNEVLLLLVRTITLSMGAVASFALFPPADVVRPTVLLVLIGLAASIPSRTRYDSPAWPIVEATAASAVINGSPTETLLLAPYLIAPSVAAGLQFGTVWTLAATASGALTAVLAAVVTSGDASSADLRWSLLALGFGLLSSLIRQSMTRQAARRDEERAYRDAGEILAELRPLIRPLSGGLDPGPIGASLIAEARRKVPFETAVVVAFLGSEQRAVASLGTVDLQSLTAQAVHDSDAERPTVRTARATDGAVVTVVPCRTSGGRVANLAVRTVERLSDDDTRGLQEVADRWALRLDAAALFDAVRDLATRAERSRIAAEIHDTVAQDVASLGLLVDDVIADASPPEEARLVRLREEISAMVADLRLSLHDLRGHGLPTGGLTAAIAEMARREGRSAGLTVNLRMGDAAAVLPPNIENELYRIAQEAVVNVRKHAQATTLWVACHVGPGGTVISVEDDGVGLGPGRADSAGLAIMAERAARIGAAFWVSTRRDGGTVVEVSLRTAGGLGMGTADDDSAHRGRPRPDQGWVASSIRAG